MIGDHPEGLPFAAYYAIGHVGLILWVATVPEYSVPPAPPGEEQR